MTEHNLISSVSWPQPGTYLLAISGGADSMVLLDLFATSERGYRLSIAHVDHGLRSDSATDAQFVVEAAQNYELNCIVNHAQLSPHASEAAARQARYQLLAQTARQIKAVAIITAHHQDDLLETSLLNLARGTGRRGLAPMQGVKLEGIPVIRPLLAISRTQLRHYVRIHQLNWHEDPTNADTTNPRNFVRHQLLPAATADWRQQYVAALDKVAALNQAIETDLSYLLDPYRATDGFRWPVAVYKTFSLTETAEVLVTAMRQMAPDHELNHRLVHELALFSQTGSPGRHRPIGSRLKLAITNQQIILLDKNASQIG